MPCNGSDLAEQGCAEGCVTSPPLHRSRPLELTLRPPKHVADHCPLIAAAPWTTQRTADLCRSVWLVLPPDPRALRRGAEYRPSVTTHSGWDRVHVPRSFFRQHAPCRSPRREGDSRVTDAGLELREGASSVWWGDQEAPTVTTDPHTAPPARRGVETHRRRRVQSWLALEGCCGRTPWLALVSHGVSTAGGRWR